MPSTGRFCASCGLALTGRFSRLPTERSPEIVASPRPPSRVGRLLSSDSVDFGAFSPGAILGGRYRVIGLLGRGGMGEVYRADDVKLGQTVALKFLPKAVSGDASLLALFRTEVRLARQVSHPNVCRMYDIGEIDGRHFLSMEYVDGEDLASLLKRIGHLPSGKAVEIARQLCAGLHAAHEKGVLHRDLKPANVMLDGKGRVRITDFGLAVAAEDAASPGEIAGTPAYMPPEVLAGKAATIQSDLYALGLVLYEIGTGKRAFEAPNLAELKRQHESEAPTAPSALIPGFDPAVERVILRCLEKDPKLRPSSALQVAAALPGGDPLAAALAAGETPSPEMVAAAGPEGAISNTRALALLGGFLVVLFSGLLLMRWGTDFGLAPLPKPPDVLTERAREVANRLGWTDPPVDTNGRFSRDRTYRNYRGKTGRPGWARELATDWWKPWYFVYRQSPRPLLPANEDKVVTQDDPPLDVSGMVSVTLDPAGKLRSFIGVPPQTLPPVSAVATPPEWDVLLSEAGLDPKAFRATAPVWLPPVPYDAIAGFSGPMPGRADVTLQVVAAAFRGRPVSFEIVAPWSQPARDAALSFPRFIVLQYDLFAIGVFLAAAVGAWFARRNTRLGRGDRRSAVRVAVAVFLFSFFETVLSAHPAAFGNGAFALSLLFRASGLAGLAWLWYLALEPYFRRRYPDLLVSWARLLGGRFRDPLVGRDLLGGLLLGCGAVLTSIAVNAVPAFFAGNGQTPMHAYPHLLDGIWGLGWIVAFTGINALMFSLGSTAILFVGSLMLRRRALAVVFLCAFSFQEWTAGDNLLFEIVGGTLYAALLAAALLSFGLVGLVAFRTAYSLLVQSPITFDLSAWYAGYGLTLVALVLALGVWGFWTARGGGPLLQAPLDV